MMSTPSKLIVIASLLLTLTGCGVAGVPQTTSNPAAKVEALFDLDGYRVYRLYDGHSVYFVLPARGEIKAPLQAMWSESCGKNCTRPVQVVTVTK